MDTTPENKETFEALEDKLEHAVHLLKALSNERRLLIVCSLCNQERSVGELEKIVELSQSALSQHLARLRKDGVVKTRRSAQTIYYSMKDESAKILLDCLMRIYCPESCEDYKLNTGDNPEVRKHRT